jgi:hypothetical protein
LCPPRGAEMRPPRFILLVVADDVA